MDFINELLRREFVVGNYTLVLGDMLASPLVIVIGLILIRVAARYLRRYMEKRSLNADLVHFLIRLTYVLGLAVIGLMALEMLNVPLTAFAFISGAVAIGVGFGAQNIINNFISGWILMWERPIRIGDFLEVVDTRGRVESINARSTRIRRVDGVHLLIPNSQLLENTVVNWTLVDALTRGEVIVGVAYGSPVRRVAEIFEQVLIDHDEILGDPLPLVFFNDFGDNALQFIGYFWVNATSERDLRKIRSDVRFSLYELLEAEDIVIAFPQRDVHLDGEITIRRPQETVAVESRESAGLEPAPPAEQG